MSYKQLKALKRRNDMVKPEYNGLVRRFLILIVLVASLSVMINSNVAASYAPRCAECECMEEGPSKTWCLNHCYGDLIPCGGGPGNGCREFEDCICGYCA